MAAAVSASMGDACSSTDEASDGEGEADDDGAMPGLEDPDEVIKLC
jgi:hypothetical protein